MSETPNSRKLEHLSVSDGQPVTAAGRLVELADGAIGLLWWRDEPWPAAAILPANASVVRLSHGGSDSGSLAPDWLGRYVTVTGVWDTGVLHISNAVDHEPPASAVEPSVRGTATLGQLAKVDAVETEEELFASGAILWRFYRALPSGEEEVIVSAVDAHQARTALQPLYGARLRIYQSPWSAADLAALDAVIDTIDPARQDSRGAGISSDGLVFRSLTLTYLDENLAKTLSQFPSGMLLLETQVTPLPLVTPPTPNR